MKNSKSVLASLVSAAGLEPVNLDLRPAKKGLEVVEDLSPVAGDHAFFTYFVPGAVFQAKDGSQWQVENIPTEGSGLVRIRNIWYPREEATIPQARIRETIDMWVFPVIQPVPAIETK